MSSSESDQEILDSTQTKAGDNLNKDEDNQEPGGDNQNLSKSDQERNEEDLVQDIINAQYDLCMDKLTSYFTTIPKIRDCLVYLFDKEKKRQKSISEITV